MITMRLLREGEEWDCIMLRRDGDTLEEDVENSERGGRGGGRG